MKRRLQRNLVSIALLAAVVAVTRSNPTLADPSTTGSEPRRGDEATGRGDESFATVARRVPQFGGAFIDEAAGALYIWLTDPRRDVVESAKTAFADAFGQEFVRDKIVGLQARYTFVELKKWHDAMTDVLRLRRVVFTDINDRKNRLTVAIEDRERDGAQVEEELARLEIPREAVDVEEHAPITFALGDQRRPILGGVQIEFQTGFLGLGTAICMLGIPGEISGGTDGFVTNSHCSRTRGEVDDGRYWQPSRPLLDTGQVGHEIVDPPYTTVDADCPSGRVCRLSDSNFVQASVGVDQGRIARPALGSADWNGTSTFRVTATGNPPTGAIATKVGRTTGRTKRRGDLVLRKRQRFRHEHHVLVSRWR